MGVLDHEQPVPARRGAVACAHMPGPRRRRRGKTALRWAPLPQALSLVTGLGRDGRARQADHAQMLRPATRRAARAGGPRTCAALSGAAPPWPAATPGRGSRAPARRARQDINASAAGLPRARRRPGCAGPALAAAGSRAHQIKEASGGSWSGAGPRRINARQPDMADRSTAGARASALSADAVAKSRAWYASDAAATRSRYAAPAASARDAAISSCAPPAGPPPSAARAHLRYAGRRRVCRSRGGRPDRLCLHADAQRPASLRHACSRRKQVRSHPRRRAASACPG